MQPEESIKELVRTYAQLNVAARCSNGEPILKLTSKVLATTHEIAIATDENSFEKLTKNLYILFYEASGYGTRLPPKLDEKRVIHIIKEMRNHFEHDREQGNDAQVRKKFGEVGNIFDFLIGKRLPTSQQDWVNAGDALVRLCVDLSERIMKNLVDPRRKQDGKSQEMVIEEFFEHEITIFPEKKQNSRLIRTHGEFSRLSASVLFIPTFRYAAPPEFGSTQSAIYLASDAPRGDFEGFSRFLHAVERNWNEENSYGFQPDSKLMPWSICRNGSIAYGSGVKTLLKETGRCYKTTRATVSMMLQGTYGDEISNTFFIIIGSDVKGGRFGYNFLDFYLGNVPIEWDWINSMNRSLDEISTYNRKASSYTLRSYFYNVWEGAKDVSLSNGVIGGIGRNGYDNRDWDTFEGLILSKKELDMDFVRDGEMSWAPSFHCKTLCPNADLDEFVVSVTNHAPDVGELQAGKFVGISKPRIDLLEFAARGWTISAICVNASSIFRYSIYL